MPNFEEMVRPIPGSQTYLDITLGLCFTGKCEDRKALVTLPAFSDRSCDADQIEILRWFVARQALDVTPPAGSSIRDGAERSHISALVSLDVTGHAGRWMRR